tara:strand:+ start:246 stop:533 length:288 start_codon:yes stop_codon:yes gene_type:complete
MKDNQKAYKKITAIKNANKDKAIKDMKTIISLIMEQNRHAKKEDFKIGYMYETDLQISTDEKYFYIDKIYIYDFVKAHFPDSDTASDKDIIIYSI